MRSFPPVFRQVFRNHLITTSIAAIVSGILADNAKAAGAPGLATHLIGAAGEVASASYSQELYEIAKLVRGNAALSAAFEAGTAGLADRLKAMPEAAEFNDAFARFIARHGHRGPNDWELSSRTWENTPELALVAIDRMRLAEHDLSPAKRLTDMEARRQAAVERVLPHVKLMDKGNFKKAVKALPHWTRAREATRDRAVRTGTAMKRVFRELVRRAAAKSGIDDPRMVAMLRFHDELPAYLRDPASLAPVIRERWALRERFAAVTPPFFINAQGEVPSIEQMEAAQGAKPTPAAAGATLQRRRRVARRRARPRPHHPRSGRRARAESRRHPRGAADRSRLDAAVPAGQRRGGECRRADEPRRHRLARARHSVRDRRRRRHRTDRRRRHARGRRHGRNGDRAGGVIGAVRRTVTAGRVSFRS